MTRIFQIIAAIYVAIVAATAAPEFVQINGSTPSQPDSELVADGNVASPLAQPETGTEEPADLTENQQELLDFAFERFDAAGFDRPDVSIEFPDDRTECFGYGGVYLPEIKAVRICMMIDTTIVHELVHAWIDENLTQDDRSEFLTLRGLDSWAYEGEWDEQGAEHAAEIITWGLMDRNISIRWVEANDDGTSTTTWRLAKLPDDSDPDRLFEAFENLTGTDAEERRLDDPRTTATTTILSPEAAR